MNATLIFSDEATCGESMDQTQFLFKSLQYPSPIPNNTMNCGLKVSLPYEKVVLKNVT